MKLELELPERYRGKYDKVEDADASAIERLRSHLEQEAMEQLTHMDQQVQLVDSELS